MPCHVGKGKLESRRQAGIRDIKIQCAVRRQRAGKASLKRTGAEVSARREEWKSGWEEKYVVGPDGGSLPSMKTGFEGEGQGSWRVPGEKVVIQGKSFIVRAFEEL